MEEPIATTRGLSQLAAAYGKLVSGGSDMEEPIAMSHRQVTKFMSMES
jgi:hypothetical protein